VLQCCRECNGAKSHWLPCDPEWSECPLREAMTGTVLRHIRLRKAWNWLRTGADKKLLLTRLQTSLQ
jgi:hypothetical protein